MPTHATNHIHAKSGWENSLCGVFIELFFAVKMICTPPTLFFATDTWVHTWGEKGINQINSLLNLEEPPTQSPLVSQVINKPLHTLIRMQRRVNVNKIQSHSLTHTHTHANNAATTQTDTTSRCWVALVMRRVVDGAHLCLWLSTVLLCDAAQAAGRGVQELPKSRSHWTHTRRLAGDALLTAHGGLLSPPSPPSESQRQTAALLLLPPSLSPPFTRTVAAATEGRLGAADCDQQIALSLSLALCLSTKSSSKLPWLWRKMITKSFLPPFSAYLW